jgi:hypothetical protein
MPVFGFLPWDLLLNDPPHTTHLTIGSYSHNVHHWRGTIALSALGRRRYELFLDDLPMWGFVGEMRKDGSGERQGVPA